MLKHPPPLPIPRKLECDGPVEGLCLDIQDLSLVTLAKPPWKKIPKGSHVDSPFQDESPKDRSAGSFKPNTLNAREGPARSCLLPTCLDLPGFQTSALRGEALSECTPLLGVRMDSVLLEPKPQVPTTLPVIHAHPSSLAFPPTICTSLCPQRGSPRNRVPIYLQLV